MNKYKVVLRYETEINAKNEDEAYEKFFEDVETTPQQTLATFVSDNLNVKQAFLASKLKEDALQSVLENNAYINVEDNFWHKHDDTPSVDMEELGLEIDTSKMNWDLEARYHQLFFSQDGIHITDLNKLLKVLKKDLKLKQGVINKIKSGDIDLTFETRHYDSGDGKSLFASYSCSDNGEKAIEKMGIDFDAALQEWFDVNVINHILNYYQERYDYLTSKEAIVEKLDANEHYFAADGQRL